MQKTKVTSNQRLNSLLPLLRICHKSRLEDGRKLGLLAQGRSPFDEHQGNWNHDERETSKKCTGPLHTQVLKHLLREQGECSSHRGSNNGIRSKHRCGTRSQSQYMAPR